MIKSKNYQSNLKISSPKLVKLKVNFKIVFNQIGSDHHSTAKIPKLV